MILVVPVWQTQPWYPRLLQLLIANPTIIPHMPNLLLNAQKEVHPLVANKTLRLAALKVSGNPLLIQGYQSRPPVLSPVIEGQVQTQITIRPGENELAGVLETKTDLVQCSVNLFYIFLPNFLIWDLNIGQLIRTSLLFQYTIVVLKGNLLDNTSKCVLFSGESLPRNHPSQDMLLHGMFKLC